MKQITQTQHIVLFLFALIVVACKGTTAPTTNVFKNLNPDERLAEVFEIQLKATVNRNDEFRIYYTTKETTEFSENQVIRVKIVGLSEEQIIIYKFPLGIYPSNLRFDFGFNSNQQTTEINAMIFIDGQQKKVIDGKNLLEYFSILYGTGRFDKNLKQLQRVNDQGLSPIIIAKKKLIKQIFHNQKDQTQNVNQS